MDCRLIGWCSISQRFSPVYSDHAEGCRKLDQTASSASQKLQRAWRRRLLHTQVPILTLSPWRLQVSERNVLAQRAYILFYIQRSQKGPLHQPARAGPAPAAEALHARAGAAQPLQQQSRPVVYGPHLPPKQPRLASQSAKQGPALKHPAAPGKFGRHCTLAQTLARCL